MGQADDRRPAGKDPHRRRPVALGRVSSLRHPVREADEPPAGKEFLRPGVAAEDLERVANWASDTELANIVQRDRLERSSVPSPDPLNSLPGPRPCSSSMREDWGP